MNKTGSRKFEITEQCWKWKGVLHYEAGCNLHGNIVRTTNETQAAKEIWEHLAAYHGRVSS